jgi:hypothetical protein
MAKREVKPMPRLRTETMSDAGKVSFVFLGAFPVVAEVVVEIGEEGSSSFEMGERTESVVAVED